MERSTPWLVAAVCALVGGGLWTMRMRQVGAASRQDPHAIVRKAYTEGRRVALTGRQQIRMPGEGGKTLQFDAQVTQSPEGKIKIEYLTPPLKGVTIWDDTERIYRYNPRRKRLRVATTRGAGDDTEIRLLENYHLRFHGVGKVAGRKAVAIEMHPRSESSRWKRIWVEPTTSVILASEEFGKGQDLLRSTRFMELRYLAADEMPAASTFQPSEELVKKFGSARPGDTSTRFTPEQLSKLIGFQVRVPKWLSPGYELRGAYQTPCTCARTHQAARLEFTDGLNTISLFECAHPQCISTTNCFARGANADLAVSHEYKSGKERMYLLAVGIAPREDLKRMINETVP